MHVECDFSLYGNTLEWEPSLSGISLLVNRTVSSSYLLQWKASIYWVSLCPAAERARS
jgi:hypothetical protein